jgi:hypothetical protein
MEFFTKLLLSVVLSEYPDSCDGVSEGFVSPELEAAQCGRVTHQPEIAKRIPSCVGRNQRSAVPANRPPLPELRCAGSGLRTKCQFAASSKPEVPVLILRFLAVFVPSPPQASR